MTLTRTGGPSGSGSSRDSSTGTQKRRNSAPIAVPGPVRVSISFCAWVSMRCPPRPLFAAELTPGRTARKPAHMNAA